MRVLQINTVNKIKSTGRTTYELDQAMKLKGIESFIACPSLNNTDCDFKISSKFDMKIHSLLSHVTGLQGCFSKNATKDLLKFISEIKPDIVILRVLHSNFINVKLLLEHLGLHNIPTIVVLHDLWFCTGHCCYPIYTSCEKYKSKCEKCNQIRFDNTSWFFDTSTKMQNMKMELFTNIRNLAVIGVSNWASDCAKESQILKQAKIHKTIYNWIDLEKFKRISIDYRSILGLMKNDFVVLSVSTKWSEGKGIYDILELAKLHKNMKFILVGKLSENINLYENIIHIPFTNDVDELIKLYNCADTFVSLSKFETFGKVIAEAISCGTPAIVYDTTACPELIGEGCGYVVEKGNLEEVKERIQLIKKNGKQHYEASCLKFSKKNFDIEKNVNEYIGLFKLMIENKEKSKSKGR